MKKRLEPYVVRTGLFLENKGTGFFPITHELVFCLCADDDDVGGWLAPINGDRLPCQAWVRQNEKGDLLELGSCDTKPSRHKVISLREACDRGLLQGFLGGKFEKGALIMQMSNFVKALDLRPPMKARRSA